MRFQDFLNMLTPGMFDKHYKVIASKHSNPNVRNYFEYEFEQKSLQTSKMAVMTRFQNALSNYYVAKIFDCEKSWKYF